MRLLLLFCTLVPYCTYGQLHDLEVTTEPSWAPTGRLNQFNGFASPRPSLLPKNAQMVYASVWAAWSAWSFCSDSKRIRVRACNTVRGFRCLGPNQETEPCDPATSPFRGIPRVNSLDSDYDVVDPWQEDRIEALKQLYPDESIDEKLNRLPEHEKRRLLSRMETTIEPPVLVSHQLLDSRPSNDRMTGAPGSTPDKIFGAKSFGAKAYAVKNGEQAIKLEEFDGFPTDLSDIKGISDITKFSPKSGESRETNEPKNKQKSRGEGTFTRKNKEKIESVEDEMEEDFPMDSPQFQGKQFVNDVFGSIEELMAPPTTTVATTTVATTTVPPTTTTVTTTTTTTTKVAPTTTTTYRTPTRVTPRPPKVTEEETVELVTPAMEVGTVLPTVVLSTVIPEEMNFFEEENMEEVTTRKPWKVAIHDGEVVPVTTMSTMAPKPIPEEISLDTLHALDWMLANMTKAAEEGKFDQALAANDLRLDSSPSEPPFPDTKVVKKIPKKLRKKMKAKQHNTRVIKLHYGEIEPTRAEKKFPKFRNRHAHRAKIFGIKTANTNENTQVNMPIAPVAYSTDVKQKQNELVDEISDIQDLMEQMDERIESRSALMEETPDSYPISKHEHDSPYRTV